MKGREELVLGGGTMDLIVLNQFTKMMTQNYDNNLPSWLKRGLDRGPENGARDINQACGYPDTNAISVRDYKEMYDRESIAARVVEVMPKESWKVTPEVYEDESPENNTEFEQAFTDLCRSLRGISWYQGDEGNPLWRYFERADKNSRIAHFGVILIGYNDGVSLRYPVSGFPTDQGMSAEELFSSVGTDRQYNDVNMQPVTVPNPQMQPVQESNGSAQRISTNPLTVMYLRTYDQSLVEIVQYEGSRNSPRFGQPVMYRITLNDPNDKASGIGLPLATLEVHWSRVIHVADNLGNSEIFATPPMRPCWNQLINLRKIYGGAAEGMWQGGFMGMSIETNPNLGGDVTVNFPELQDMVDRYQNSMTRSMFLEGMHANQLAPTVAAPNNHVDVCIDAICALIAMPKRILMGSERGELSSGQDDTTWNDRLMHRQNNYLTSGIIVPFIDRMIMCGVLPEPSGYSVEWPDLNVLSPLEQADLAVKRTGAYAAYMSAGADALRPPLNFLTGDIGLSDEEAAKNLEDAAEHLAEAVPDAEGEIVPGREPFSQGEHDREIEKIEAGKNDQNPFGGKKGETNGKAKKPTVNYDPSQRRDSHGRWTGSSYDAEGNYTHNPPSHSQLKSAEARDLVTWATSNWKDPMTPHIWGELANRASKFTNETELNQWWRKAMRDSSWKTKDELVDWLRSKANMTSNANSNHDEYGRFASAAKEASKVAKKSGKSRDHAKAADLHTKAATMAHSKHHEDWAGYHRTRSEKAGDGGAIGKVKGAFHKAGMIMDRANIPYSVANAGFNPDEARDDHGRWSLGGVGRAFKSFSTKVKKNFKTASKGSTEQRLKAAKSKAESLVARDLNASRMYSRYPDKYPESKRSRREAALESIGDKVEAHKGKLIVDTLAKTLSKTTIKHLDKTADDIVKSGIKTAKSQAKIDHGITAWGVMGKKKTPFRQYFSTPEKFESFKSVNKAEIHGTERPMQTEQHAPSRKLRHAVRENLTEFAKEGLKTLVKEDIPDIARQTAQQAIALAVVSIAKAVFNGEKHVTTNQTADKDFDRLVADLIRAGVDRLNRTIGTPSEPVGNFGRVAQRGAW